MDSILVRGNGALSGQIPIAGAKNACLTLMPATILSEEPLTLTNAPRLSDIKTMTTLLQSLGAEVTSLQDGKVQAMSSHNLDNHVADYEIVRKMRASNLVLGPMLARLGHAVVSLLEAVSAFSSRQVSPSSFTQASPNCPSESSLSQVSSRGSWRLLFI